jgi:aspartyl/asparaginyl-tRNA synthetases
MIMMKKYLILLAGPPATGKSYLSRLICQALPETYTVSPDELKENLADNIGYNSLEEKVELEKVVWDYYYQALELYMKIGKQFILTEYPFSYKQKPILEKLTTEYKYDIITIRLVCDFETLWNRRIQRDLSEDRHLSYILSHYHYGDTCRNRSAADQLITKEEFAEIIQARDYNHFEMGKLYEVDVTDYSNVDYEPIIEELKELK